MAKMNAGLVGRDHAERLAAWIDEFAREHEKRLSKADALRAAATTAADDGARIAARAANMTRQSVVAGPRFLNC